MSDSSSPKLRKLLDLIRNAISLKHHSYSSEKLCSWGAIVVYLNNYYICNM